MKNLYRYWIFGALCLLIGIAVVPMIGADVLAEVGDTSVRTLYNVRNRLKPGALVALSLPGDSEDQLEYVFTPSANGLYAIYLFPAEGELHAEVELVANHQKIASGSGSMRVLSCRLTADVEYSIRLHGTGTAMLEVARETLSRCFDMPLELEDGEGYAKLIAREGDVHWYKVVAARDGAALFAGVPVEKGLRLRARLFDASGKCISHSDTLESGTFALSAAFEEGQAYYLRVSSSNQSTGKYFLNCQRSTATNISATVMLAQSSMTMEGRTRVPLEYSLQSNTLVLLDSSNPDVAVVLSDGTVESKLPGTSIITAYTYGGAQSQCTVEVAEVAVERIEIAVESLSVRVGDEGRVDVSIQPQNASEQGLNYVSEDDSVVVVDAQGTFYAVGVGTTRVAAISMDGGLADVVSITVEPAERRCRVLLIGEQNYASTVDKSRPGSIRSVESLQKLLATGTIEGMPFVTSTLMDAPRDEVIAVIRDTFAGATEQDISIIYITCHGFYKGGMTFFVMADGSVLSATELERELRSIPGKIVLLVDCCGSGGLLGEAGEASDILEGITSVFQGAMGSASFNGSKYYVIASALLDQDSYRINFAQDGSTEGMTTVFARALCDGMGWSIDRDAQGAMNADINYNGEVTLDELYSYMSRRVMWYLRLAGDYAQNVRVYPEGESFVLFERG